MINMVISKFQALACPGFWNFCGLDSEKMALRLDYTFIEKTV